MTTDAQVMLLFQWLSPAYPVGGFAYSHGLEWAVAEGDVADAADLRLWLDDVLAEGAGRCDAILLAVAHAAPDAAALAEVEAAARALAPSRERRFETGAQGAAFCRITADLWPDTPGGPLCYPVALGRAARLRGLPVGLTVAMYLQAFAANLVSAGIRLIPIGQTEGQAILAALRSLCLRLADAAAGQGLDDLSSASFLADIASMKHETQYARIFRT